MILRNSLTLGLAVITTVQLFENTRPIIGYRQDDTDDETNLLYYTNHANNALLVDHNNNNDRHYESLAVLNLLDWEIESIQGNNDENDAGKSQASCNPPFHVSKQCCIGTFSTGGDIDYKQRHRCHATTLEQYQQLQQQQHHDSMSSSFSSTKCDICRVLQIASERSLSIAFFGDSMTNQVVQGLQCELQRRNYQVRDERVVLPNHAQQEDDTSAGQGRRHRDKCKRCIKQIRILHVSSPTLGTEVTIKFFFQYRYPFQDPQEELDMVTSADILILNLGLHWAWNGRTPEMGRMHYRKSMADFFRFVKETTNTSTRSLSSSSSSSSQLLIWRETSAQHFDADGGDWGLRKTNDTVSTSTNQCVPIRNFTTAAAAWRESKVLAAAKAQGYRVVSAMDTTTPYQLDEPPTWSSSQEDEVVMKDDHSGSHPTPPPPPPELVILPWWNFTAQLHMMHPATECTHYCYSPFLYVPLWKGLRLAMDRRYA
jgi:hypothetical protein